LPGSPQTRPEFDRLGKLPDGPLLVDDEVTLAQLSEDRGIAVEQCDIAFLLLRRWRVCLKRVKSIERGRYGLTITLTAALRARVAPARTPWGTTL